VRQCEEVGNFGYGLRLQPKRKAQQVFVGKL
jgi:hypothetical protein